MVKKSVGGAIAFCLLNIFLVSFLANMVLAADVAYILRNPKRVNQGFINAFSEMGLTVDLIKSTDVKKTNFNNYRLIFVGDERFRNNKDIPVNNYPSVIANYYHGKEWGLTDVDGISKLAATSPLSVRLVDNGIVQVYSQAKEGSIAIPYYYLANENKAPGFEKVAGTYTGNSFDLGDVISYANQGIRLINNKISGGKICFFGIIKTKYWTQEAKEMFKDCVGFVATTCSKNSDCGVDGLIGDKFCQNNDVWQNYQAFTCLNPGKVNSQCVNNIEPQLVEDCEDICENNQCREVECFNDDDCNDNNAYTEDNCHLPGTSLSYCTNDPIKCLNKNDCGIDGFVGDSFCQGDDIWQDYINFECNLPGTSSSYCSNLTQPKLKESCSEACSNGACVSIRCYNDSDCDDSNSWTEDKCHLPGTLDSFCTNDPIICFENLDCGVNGFVGNLYCNGPLNDDIYRDWQSYVCENPGTALSSCSASITANLTQDCSDTCINGTCVTIICYNDANCDDSNSYTDDKCHNPGTPQSYCTHGNITCLTDNDCGADHYLNGIYCNGLSGEDLYWDFLDVTCKNPGTVNSYCSNNITKNFLETCQYACSNGECVRCNNNLDCDDSDSETLDICWFSGTADSYCSHEHIECFKNSDCGIDGFIDGVYCLNDDIWQNYRTFECKNPGTPGSYCKDNITSQLVEECAFGCSGNDCLGGIHDVALIDFTNSFNGIFLEYENGTDILEEVPILSCEDTIKAKVKVENQGDFYENVTLNGELNGISFNLNDIDNLAPTDTSFRSSLSPYISLASLFGIYNIFVEALIPIDDDLSDNNASREIEILCPEGECEDDDDCPVDYCNPWQDNYCKNNDVWKNQTCYDNGCLEASCYSNPWINETLVDDCEENEICENGECQEVCQPDEFSKIWTCGSGLSCRYDEVCKASGVGVMDEIKTYKFSLPADAEIGEYNCTVTIKRGQFGYYDPDPYNQQPQPDETMKIKVNGIYLGKASDPFCNTEKPKACSSTCKYYYYYDGTWRPDNWCKHCTFDVIESFNQVVSLETNNTISLEAKQSHAYNYLSVNCIKPCEIQPD